MIMGDFTLKYEPGADVLDKYKEACNKYHTTLTDNPYIFYEVAINVAKTAYWHACSPQDRLEAGTVGWLLICEYDRRCEGKFK